MGLRKSLFAILGGMALTTVLTPYKDSSKRKQIVGKAKGYTETAEETIEDSVANVKSRVKKMGEDADRMINEGGNVVKNVNEK